MSIHISAMPGEIEKIVLMPGDPLRAKYIADNFLQHVKLVSSTRNIYFFTGTYNDVPLTVGASGMGCPSIGIYSYELFTEFEADCIIRIGTCGAYLDSINLFDVINVEKACSESTYAQTAFGFTEDQFDHQGKAYDLINETAKALKIPLLNGAIHSGDAFYSIDRKQPKIAKKNNCLAAEMEAFALFANAKHFNKTAAALVTVSDNIITRQKISAEQREKSMAVMTELALESVVKIHQTAS